MILIILQLVLCLFNLKLPATRIALKLFVDYYGHENISKSSKEGVLIFQEGGGYMLTPHQSRINVRGIPIMEL